MSYFSECAKHAGSNSFLIPYNRQQLADYLNVDRSTMCNELSKMQKDGMIEYKKNRILLKDWDLRNGMNLNRDWFFKQKRLWSEIEYSAIIHSYRASAVSYTHLDVYKRQEYSYIKAVKWSAFIKSYSTYIKSACERQDCIDDYDICKEVWSNNRFVVW